MNRNPPTPMDLPPNLSLPLFVYGALKPGMPAYEALRQFVLGTPQRESVPGDLYVRDGLPLLILDGGAQAEGFLLQWVPGKEHDAYQLVCDFEPPEHYAWASVTIDSRFSANVLVARYSGKGNPQPLYSRSWSLVDDPAFGVGLKVIRSVSQEIADNREWDDMEKFFRAQMAYLLLWSILERLSALCFGPRLDPNERIKRLHELPGMTKLVQKVVRRNDRVTDSRDPSQGYILNAENAKKTFQYYYQVRSNLSHRGKAVHNEVGKVRDSLNELLEIVDGFLDELRNPAVRT